MEENELGTQTELFKSHLRSFLCGMGACVDMLLDLLDDDEDIDFKSMLDEMFNEENTNKKDSTKIIETNMSFDDFKKLMNKLNKEEE